MFPINCDLIAATACVEMVLFVLWYSIRHPDEF